MSRFESAGWGAYQDRFNNADRFRRWSREERQEERGAPVSRNPREYRQENQEPIVREERSYRTTRDSVEDYQTPPIVEQRDHRHREETHNHWRSWPRYIEHRIRRESTETRDSLEYLKNRLNRQLMWYFEEVREHWYSREKKELFLETFHRLSRPEKQEYLKYVVKAIEWKCWKEDVEAEENALGDLLKDMRGIDKMEVYAWLSNACRQDRYEWRDDREYYDDVPSFEIAWWTIRKKVIGISKKWFYMNEKTFQITWVDIDSLWNNMFRIYLEWRRKVWDIISTGIEEDIVIRFVGRNIIQVFDSQWERSLGIVRMRDTWDDRGRGHHRERTKNISFEINGTEINLDLIIDR